MWYKARVISLPKLRFTWTSKLFKLHACLFTIGILYEMRKVCGRHTSTSVVIGFKVSGVLNMSCNDLVAGQS